LDGAWQSSLLSSRLAADLAYVKAKKNGISAVEVTNSRGFVWLVQNTVQIAKRGMECSVSWSDEHGDYFAIMKPDMGQPLISRKSSASNEEKTSFMIICAEPGSLSFNVSEKTVILQPDVIEERWHSAMKNGQEVDNMIWNKLAQVASRVLVEATELSRLKGAGEMA
jgi:LDH2 family malate/lactate/ureidoglycolate dehydrogenase